MLQEGEIQRVGSDNALTVDVRILAGTNRDLWKMVAEGKFREDLYYRLNVVTIEVPPLRDRPEDIPLLADHFIRQFAAKNHKSVRGITPRAMDLLLRYQWPGNIRELENTMERSVILLQGEYISERELPMALLKPQDGGQSDTSVPPGSPDTEEETITLEELERRKIPRTLEELDGNKSEAARRLGITRRTLKLKLKKYGTQDPLEGHAC